MDLPYYWLVMPFLATLAFLVLILLSMRQPVEVLDLSYNKTKNQLELNVRNKKNKEYHIKSSLRLIKPTEVDGLRDSYKHDGMVMLSGSTAPYVRKMSYDLVGEDDEPLILKPYETKTLVYDVISPVADLKTNNNVKIELSYGREQDFLNRILRREIPLKRVDDNTGTAPETPDATPHTLQTVDKTPLVDYPMTSGDTIKLPPDTISPTLDDASPVDYSAGQTLTDVNINLREKKFVEDVPKVTRQKKMKPRNPKLRTVKPIPKISVKGDLIKPPKAVERIKAKKVRGIKTVKKTRGEGLRRLENKRKERIRKQEERIAKQKERLAKQKEREEERKAKQKERIAKQEERIAKQKSARRRGGVNERVRLTFR